MVEHFRTYDTFNIENEEKRNKFLKNAYMQLSKVDYPAVTFWMAQKQVCI